MNKDSELIIEVADEYDSLKSFESGNRQMDDFIHDYLSACSRSHFCITYYVRFKPNLAVNKNYQNLKIGSALIDFIANIARNQKVSGCIFLTVNALHTNSYSAVSFYEKNHFAKLTPVPQFDVWPMYKTLWY